MVWGRGLPEDARARLCTPSAVAAALAVASAGVGGTGAAATAVDAATRGLAACVSAMGATAGRGVRLPAASSVDLKGVCVLGFVFASRSPVPLFTFTRSASLGRVRDGGAAQAGAVAPDSSAVRGVSCRLPIPPPPTTLL